MDIFSTIPELRPLAELRKARDGFVNTEQNLYELVIKSTHDAVVSYLVDQIGDENRIGMNLEGIDPSLIAVMVGDGIDFDRSPDMLVYDTKLSKWTDYEITVTRRSPYKRIAEKRELGYERVVCLKIGQSPALEGDIDELGITEGEKNTLLSLAFKVYGAISNTWTVDAEQAFMDKRGKGSEQMPDPFDVEHTTVVPEPMAFDEVTRGLLKGDGLPEMKELRQTMPKYNNSMEKAYLHTHLPIQFAGTRAKEPFFLKDCEYKLTIYPTTDIGKPDEMYTHYEDIRTMRKGSREIYAEDIRTFIDDVFMNCDIKGSKFSESTARNRHNIFFEKSKPKQDVRVEDQGPRTKKFYPCTDAFLRSGDWWLTNLRNTEPPDMSGSQDTSGQLPEEASFIKKWIDDTAYGSLVSAISNSHLVLFSQLENKADITVIPIMAQKGKNDDYNHVFGYYIRPRAHTRLKAQGSGFKMMVIGIGQSIPEAAYDYFHYIYEWDPKGNGVKEPLVVSAKVTMIGPGIVNHYAFFDRCLLEPIYLLSRLQEQLGVSDEKVTNLKNIVGDPKYKTLIRAIMSLCAAKALADDPSAEETGYVCSVFAKGIRTRDNTNRCFSRGVDELNENLNEMCQTPLGFTLSSSLMSSQEKGLDKLAVYHDTWLSDTTIDRHPYILNV
jgi:hypothetical protein